MPKKLSPPRRGELLSDQLLLEDHQIFARIFVAEDGGPIRTLITGREHHATGRFVSVKAGHRALPWESLRGELPALELMEAAPPVHRMMAQPHRLEMIIEGVPAPLVFFPDLRLTVDARFASALAGGVPFLLACAEWRPDASTAGDTRELIVEVKTANDPRNADPVYQSKLALAEEVYGRIGWQFFQFVDPTGLGYSRIAHAVREIVLDHDVIVSPHEVHLAQKALSDGPVTLDAVLDALGGNVAAIQKACALHVRRLLCIDIAGRLAPESMVFPMGSIGGAA